MASGSAGRAPGSGLGRNRIGPGFEHIEPYYQTALQSDDLHGTEADVVRSYLLSMHLCEDRIPVTKKCTVVREMAFHRGRADIVIFHTDGSASVIEAKDGTRGYQHVLSGIGQSGLYAAQLAMTRAVRPIRRCLLWSSTGDMLTDVLVEQACDDAGVVSLPCETTREIVAVRRAAAAYVADHPGGGS